jgi:AraC-like DNA-binding protein
MNYREIRPVGPAAEVVDRLWFLEMDSGPVQRIVPDCRPELIFNLGQPFESFRGGAWRQQPQSFLVGQLTGPLQVRPAGPARIMGIRFRPEGAAALLRLPMHELTGCEISLHDLPAALRSPDSLDRLVRNCKVDRLASEAVRLIEAGGGAVDVARLARGLGISTRQLERRFKDAVGLSPKLFCRIQRFQRVFQQIEAGRGWVETALACGYYDQAHLVRDFRDFSGEAPAALLESDELARHFLRHRGMSHFSNTAPSGPA